MPASALCSLHVALTRVTNASYLFSTNAVATVHESTPSLGDWPALLQVPDQQLALGIPGQGATLVSIYMICKLHAAMHACHSLELQGSLL